MSDEQTPAPRGPRSAAWTLTIVLIVLFIIQFLLDGLDTRGVVRMGATYPELIPDGAWWTMLSSTMLHMTVMHIVANAYFTAVVGGRVEQIVGGARMLVVFFAGGITGSLLTVWISPSVISAGASGGAWGLMLAELALIAIPSLRGGQPPPATLREVATLIGLNAILSFQPGIDGLAHFGGGFGGVAAILISHVGRPLWIGAAILLSTAHVAAVGYAVWDSRAWLGEPVPSTLVEHEIGDWFTVTLPAGVATQLANENEITAGSFWKHGISYVAGFYVRLNDEPQASWFRDFLEFGYIANESSCGPECLRMERVDSQIARAYLTTHAIGEFEFLTMIFVAHDLSVQHHSWAEKHLSQLSRLSPKGIILAQGLAESERYAGNDGEAIRMLQELLRWVPNDPGTLNSLAWIYATSTEDSLRDGAQAIAMAAQAVQQRPDDGNYVDTLAAAYAEVGDFEQAVATAERAVRMEPLNATLSENLETIRSGNPIRSSPKPLDAPSPPP